jgi:hypothetical protein
MFPTMVIELSFVALLFSMFVVISMVSEVSKSIVLLIRDKIDDYRHTQCSNKQAEAHYADEARYKADQDFENRLLLMNLFKRYDPLVDER